MANGDASLAMRLPLALVPLLAIGLAVGRPAAGDSPPPAGLAAAPDYGSSADWVCRPGAESVCTSGLDATVVDAVGARHLERFAPAADPAIDCFYVYPTVSREATPYADLRVTPEVAAAVNAQAGRLTSRCRVFAPVYRQATLAHLRAKLGGDTGAEGTAPYDDVRAAWAYYLAHDNGGRGVVLVGHSQGTILLQRLIAAEIDGAPARRLLVAAFLAGDPSLGVPPGRDAGGTFARVPVCASAAQIGCAYVWGSYRDADATERPIFGHERSDGLTSACATPAAPGGGSGMAEFYHRDASARAGDPAWIESVGQISVACRDAAGGRAVRVTVESGPFAAADAALLDAAQIPSGWGLHKLDVALVQGNVLDVLMTETKAWLAAHPR